MRSFILALLVVGVACSDDSPVVVAPEVHDPKPKYQDMRTAGVGEAYVAVVIAQQSQTVVAVDSGNVASIAVHVGDRVEKGQEMLRLDLKELQAQMKVALAAQSSAQAARSKAAIEVDEASRQVALSRRLYHENVRSRESLNQASFALRRSQANLREFGGNAKQRAVHIEELRHKLGQTSMRASISGVVSSVDVHEGESVAGGQRLLRILEPDDLAIRFAVPDKELSRLSSGSRVKMDIDGKVVDFVVVNVSPNVAPGLRLGFALAIPDSHDALRGIVPGTVGRVLPLLDDDNRMAAVANTTLK